MYDKSIYLEFMTAAAGWSQKKPSHGIRKSNEPWPRI